MGATALAAGALLLYAERGFLSSAGFLIALTLLAVAAGLWVGAPDGPLPGHRRTMTRWMFAIAAMVLASFMAMAWLRAPVLQATAWGRPLAVVILLAEPAYAIGALLAALEARRRGWLARDWLARGGSGEGRAGGVAVPALTGFAVGAVLAAAWLIPSMPPGPVYLGTALLLATAGTFEMRAGRDGRSGSMAERVVVVTGVGGKGQVGYALAESFLAQGARLVVTGRTDAVEAHARELGDGVAWVAADLATPEGAEAVVDAARQRWGRLDVLVNVAGGLHVIRPLSETTPDEFDREIRANAVTTYNTCRAALPLLRASRGCILNFASPAGQRAVGGMAAYSAAKAGVVALTRALALEEREHGVRVNAIAPGMVDTEQNRSQVEDVENVGWVTREEIAAVTLFLTSPEGSGINGQVVQVPGRGLK